jgi:hypothetical protein
MIQIKKLKRPTRKSGFKLQPGETAEMLKTGVTIINTGKNTLYVDRVTPKKKKSPKKAS